MTPGQRRPLRSRLNLHHDWQDESTDDGTRYQRCRRCGKDKTEVDPGNFDGKNLGAGLAGGGFSGSV